MRIIGAILIVLGAVVTAYALSGKTLSYETQEPVVDSAIVKINRPVEHVIPTPLWAGAGGVALGALLVFAGKRK
jgi:hypothetical protein